MANEYEISIEQFEGPLDLLLHLIRKNQVDVTDIPIVEITHQYNEYLEMMKELNLNIAADFLSMAATLIHIKARMLIPRNMEEEEDPREPLVQQLVEHQAFKDVAACFHEMAVIRHASYPRGREVTADFLGSDEEFIEAGVFDLITSFHAIMARHVVRKSLEFERIKVTISEQVSFILNKMNEQTRISIEQLFTEFKIKTVWIVGFLALLELMRLKYVKAFQKELFTEIILVRNFAVLTDDEIKEISQRFGE
ncbi:MAG: segregation/condensation protein A [Acidobacteria bacterium]|nr:MAG: segregation/condensation protein A [Acidobacteriota bacterium]PIE89819.1 MAG: segregation/condensation protein A [Acidobacteriota bacterium]